MKYRTTQKAIRAGFTYVIQAPDGRLQNLLRYHNAVAYTTRVEGWGADIWDFGNVAIVSGYAPFGKYKAGYEISRKYDLIAESILGNYNLSYEEQKSKIDVLIQDFITEVLEK